MNDDPQGDPGGSLAAVAASFTAGSRVAGYRLGEQIGAGGMAVVFRAVDERLVGGLGPGRRARRRPDPP